MKILNKLTLKHLHMNKKRTLVTIIGITLSTALMVGIGLLVSSMLTTQRLDAEESFGEYHASLVNLNAKAMSTLKRNVNIDKFYYYIPLGFAKIDSPYPRKPYLYVVNANQEFLNKLKLVKGKLPTNSNEILINECFLNYDDSYQIGTSLNLSIGTRIVEGEELDITDNNALATSWEEDKQIFGHEDLKITENRTYKIVGVIADTVYEDYYDAGIMTFSYSDKPADKYNAFIEFKKPSKTYDLISNLANDLKIPKTNIKANSNLLYYYGATKYGNINKTLISLMLIALSVISAGCIIVIYNSFAISTMERKKSFGLYASIGATMKQIRHTVFFEAFLVGIIGIILGVLGAFLGIYIVIKVINYLLKDAISLSIIFSAEPLYIIIPLIFMVLVIFLSAYLPAKRSSKVTPIEAIRGNDDIKVTKKEVKSPKYIQKLFGIEGTIAYKNIKRNKKKYRITILSLFISIVMFNTFTSFLDYFIKGSDSINYYDYDLKISLYSDISTTMKDIETLKHKYKIDESNIIIHEDSIHATNLKNSDFTSDYLAQSDYSSNNPEKTFNLIVLPDAEYNKISNEEAILRSNKYFMIYNDGNRKTIDTKVFAKDNYNITFTTDDKNSVNINAKVTTKEISGLKDTLYNHLPVIITSESTYKAKFGLPKEVNTKLLITSKNYKDIYNDLKDEKIVLDSEVNKSSPALDQANERNLIIVVKILFYGFISLITLIGVTSVINTINTNINLRRKEFAMLRSIGLSPKGFNKLLFFESLFFGLKSLIYGIPVSLAINILISLTIGNVIETKLIINWSSFLITIIAVFIIVLISMDYASKKVKKENILEALREENI